MAASTNAAAAAAGGHADKQYSRRRPSYTQRSALLRAISSQSASAVPVAAGSTAGLARMIEHSRDWAERPEFRQLLKSRLGDNLPAKGEMGHVMVVECGQWRVGGADSAVADGQTQSNGLWWLPQQGPARAWLWVRPNPGSNNSYTAEVILPYADTASMNRVTIVSGTAFEAMTNRKGRRCYTKSCKVVHADTNKPLAVCSARGAPVVCNVRGVLAELYGEDSFQRSKTQADWQATSSAAVADDVKQYSVHGVLNMVRVFT
jgi:hypothetical protein